MVGFNQAVSAARRGPAPKDNDLPNAEIGRIAHGMADVLVASTVPILGFLPFLADRVAALAMVQHFKRFFEDIATFAMDSSAHRLVARHFAETVLKIRSNARFKDEDRFIVAAHSLGSVVAHNHLVNNWPVVGNIRQPMDGLLTFGAPIGLLCWLWLFLDFKQMDLAERAFFDPFFVWKPAALPKNGLNKGNCLARTQSARHRLG